MTISAAFKDWCWRESRIGIPVPIVCAWFFSALFNYPFLRTLVYAFSISIPIQILMESGRYGFSHLLRRYRPGHAGARHNWPGWGVMLPWLVIASLLAFVGGHALADLMLGVERSPGSLYRPGAQRIVLSVIIAVTAACLYFLYVRGRMAMLDAQAQSAMRSATENQLKLLESQLEPHMLFNTLANLRVLIGIDPAQAQAMLDHLTAFLRAMLDASRTGSHALEAEFGRIGDYLELMQVRMGDRLQSRLDLPPELAALSVPALLLQPLVENAIKHGLEPQVSKGLIAISARREGNTLVLSVRDNGVGIGAHPTGGTHFGLQHVRERLAALYGAHGTLELSAPADGGALAVVRLPISPDSLKQP